MTPDVIFAHGPFHESDYEVASTLLKESAAVLPFCADAASHLEINKGAQSISKDALERPDRRMIVLVLGLKPFRHSFSQSARPEQSVINYQLLDGCPTILLPVKEGAPLVAWFAHRKTLQNMWKYDLGREEGKKGREELEAAVGALSEFLEMCVDWEKVVLDGREPLPGDGHQDSSPSSEAPYCDGERAAKTNADTNGDTLQGDQLATSDSQVSQDSKPPGGTDEEEEKRNALQASIRILLECAVRSGESDEVKMEINGERAGIAMFRLP